MVQRSCLWLGVTLAVLAACATAASVTRTTGERRLKSAKETEGHRHKRNIMYPNYNEPENFYQNQSLGVMLADEGAHHHHHGGHFQRMKPGHDRHDAIHFPSSSEERRVEIPLDFLKRLNDLENIADFFPYVVGGSLNFTDQHGPDVVNRFGDDADERKSVVNAKFAKCTPEEKTVSLLEETNDPSVVYIPSCTRVMRCGGCCSTSIMSCQPTETEIINFRVYETQYTGNNQLKMTGKKLIPIEQHTKCKCDCIMKAKDCTQFQEYRPGECSCVCINTDERDKCNAANHRKVWDSNRCVCACRQIEECTTGTVFNPSTCRCVNIPERMNRRHTSAGDLEKRRSEKRRPSAGLQPRPVVPIQINDGN